MTPTSTPSASGGPSTPPTSLKPSAEPTFQERTSPLPAGAAADQDASFSSPSAKHIMMSDVSAAVQTLHSLRAQCAPVDDALCNMLASVFDPQRAGRIKALLALASPERLQQAQSTADAAQERLRQCSKETNRTQFQAALAARDEALSTLWNITSEAKEAVASLKSMADEERRIVQSFEISLPDSRSPSTPAECPSKTIQEIIAEKDALKTHMGLLAAATAKTNRAAAVLMEAVQHEQSVFESMAACTQRWHDMREELTKHAHYFATTVHQDSELGPARVEALDTLASTLQRVESDAVQFRRNGELGPQLLDQEAKLERERLFQERQRIHLQAEIEWKRVNDEDPAKIAIMNQRLENERARIAQIVEKQAEIQRRILALINSDHPELSWKALVGGSRILKWVKGSGLWINCTFTDFRVLSTLSSTVNSKVYLVSYKGEELALKEIPMESEKARRRFQNEINITLGSAQHPNIVKIRGVFFDGPFAYIVMPYLRRGSLKTLLSKQEAIPWFRIQEIFRQLASGLVHLHERGIVHADIKPSNILFGEDGIPVIADFGIAKDYGRFGEREMTQTVSVVGTTDFMAPELLCPTGDEGHLPTARSDVWSLGVTMYTVAATNAVLHRKDEEAPAAPSFPTLMPGASCICVSPSTVGGSERLADLLMQCLTVNPALRPSVTEILSHPYFAVSLVEDLVHNKELVESNAKLEAFRSYIHVLRAGTRTPSLVSVVRGHMVESVTNIFERFEEPQLVRPIMVVFQGESGVDEGALTTEMFVQYFQQLVTKQKLLVMAKNDDSESEGDASLQLGAEYTVTSDPRASERHLVTIGKVLLKCMIENRPLPLQLNASLLKYLVGSEPSISDLEAYDRTMAQTLNRLFLLSSDDLEAADLDFSEFPSDFFEKQTLPHDITPATKVSQRNVREYVQLRVKYELIGKRENSLALIKKGFMDSPLLSPHVRLLSATELMLLLCGQQHLHPQALIDSLDFVGFPLSSGTPQHLKELITGSSQNNLRRFLRLCTASVSIPHGGLPRKIKVLCTGDTTRLPVGHSCVFQLDLPDYNNEQILRDKVATALAHVNDGFHIA